MSDVDDDQLTNIKVEVEIQKNVGPAGDDIAIINFDDDEPYGVAIELHLSRLQILELADKLFEAAALMAPTATPTGKLN